MSGATSTYFIQECPTCGRTLQVKVQHMGRVVKCRHCHGSFEACDPESASYPPESSGLELLERADRLLDSAAASQDRPAY